MMKSIVLGVFLAGSVFCTRADARDLGAVGETYPVKEMSMLKWIQQKVLSMQSSGEVERFQTSWIRRTEQQIKQPPSLHLPRNKVRFVHTYEPKVVFAHDVIGSHHVVLAKKGMSVNALTQLPHYYPHWLFIDADDAQQLESAKTVIKRWPDAKIILTGGSTFRASQYLVRPVYFDQWGKLTQKLEVRSVPAYVMRRQNRLVIIEGMPHE